MTYVIVGLVFVLWGTANSLCLKHVLLRKLREKWDIKLKTMIEHGTDQTPDEVLAECMRDLKDECKLF